ncbi:transposase [Streptomyces sp. NPDC002491]
MDGAGRSVCPSTKEHRLATAEFSDEPSVGLQIRAAVPGSTGLYVRKNHRIAPSQGSWDWIVPHGLWETAKYAIPEHQTRRQGGGTANRCDETLFAAILYVLVSGCAWRSLPPCFGVSKSTVHRRFLIWTKADVWRKLHDALLQRREEKGLIAFSRRILDSAHARTEKGVNVEIREAWTGAERIPGCMSCRTRPDCAWSSVSQPPAHS